MRLRNIYILCRDNLESIKKIEATDSKANSNYIHVVGWGEFLKVYKLLLPINGIKERVHELIESVPEIYRQYSSFHVDELKWSQIQKKRDILINSMLTVVNVYESMGMENDEQNGIDIKLPKCNDFLDFKKYIDELEFILYKCPFFKVNEEDLKFKTVDVGSIWLSFFVAGATVGMTSVLLNNIAAFMDKCMIMKSHKLNREQQELLIKSMDVQEKEKETLLASINKLFQAQTENVIKELQEEIGINLCNGEEKGIVLQSFEKTIALLDKGMQLYSTIDSSKEIQVLFEPLEMKYLSISESLKLLEKKEDKKE